MSVNKLRGFAGQSAGLALVLALTVGLSGLLSGCGEPTGLNGAVKGGPTVLTVNGVVITQNEYDKIYTFYKRVMRVAENPQGANSEVVKQVLNQMTLNQLTITALMEEQAKKLGLQVTTQDVITAKKKQEELAGGAGQLSKLLEEQHLSEDDFNNAMRNQILVTKVVEKLAADKVAVTPAEAETYYKGHLTEFTVEDSIRARHLLVKAVESELRQDLEKNNPSISQAELEEKVAAQLKAKEQKAQELFAKIKANPAQLGTLAKANSDDVLSAKNDGDLGFLTQRGTDPTFWEAAQTTPVGQLHPSVVHSPFGYHIVAVIEKKPAHKQTFDEVKTTIEEALAQQKKTDFLGGWLQEQKKVAQVKIEPAYQLQPMPTPQTDSAPASAGKKQEG